MPNVLVFTHNLRNGKVVKSTAPAAPVKVRKQRAKRNNQAIQLQSRSFQNGDYYRYQYRNQWNVVRIIGTETDMKTGNRYPLGRCQETGGIVEMKNFAKIMRMDARDIEKFKEEMAHQTKGRAIKSANKIVYI